MQSTIHPQEKIVKFPTIDGLWSQVNYWCARFSVCVKCTKTLIHLSVDVNTGYFPTLMNNYLLSQLIVRKFICVSATLSLKSDKNEREKMSRMYRLASNIESNRDDKNNRENKERVRIKAMQ